MGFQGEKDMFVLVDAIWVVRFQGREGLHRERGLDQASDKSIAMVSHMVESKDRSGAEVKSAWRVCRM